MMKMAVEHGLGLWFLEWMGRIYINLFVMSYYNKIIWGNLAHLFVNLMKFVLAAIITLIQYLKKHI